MSSGKGGTAFSCMGASSSHSHCVITDKVYMYM